MICCLASKHLGEHLKSTEPCSSSSQFRSCPRRERDDSTRSGGRIAVVVSRRRCRFHRLFWRWQKGTLRVCCYRLKPKHRPESTVRQGLEVIWGVFFGVGVGSSFDLFFGFYFCSVVKCSTSGLWVAELWSYTVLSTLLVGKVCVFIWNWAMKFEASNRGQDWFDFDNLFDSMVDENEITSGSIVCFY